MKMKESKEQIELFLNSLSAYSNSLLVPLYIREILDRAYKIIRQLLDEQEETNEQGNDL